MYYFDIYTGDRQRNSVDTTNTKQSPQPTNSTYATEIKHAIHPLLHDSDSTNSVKGHNYDPDDDNDISKFLRVKSWKNLNSEDRGHDIEWEDIIFSSDDYIDGNNITSGIKRQVIIG